jgi:hypothetical protein
LRALFEKFIFALKRFSLFVFEDFEHKLEAVVLRRSENELLFKLETILVADLSDFSDKNPGCYFQVNLVFLVEV